MNLFVGEEVEQEGRPGGADVGVLLYQGGLDEVIVQPFMIDVLLDVLGIVEEQLHQSRVALAGRTVGIEGDLGAVGHHAVAQQFVLMVKIPHIVERAVHGDPQLRVERHHLQHGRAHRQDAAVDIGAAGVDEGLALEHLGEVLHHALGYHALLFLANAGQVAPPPFRVVDDNLQLVLHLPAEGGELA